MADEWCGGGGRFPTPKLVYRTRTAALRAAMAVAADARLFAPTAPENWTASAGSTVPSSSDGRAASPRPPAPFPCGVHWHLGHAAAGRPGGPTTPAEALALLASLENPVRQRRGR